MTSMCLCYALKQHFLMLLLSTILAVVSPLSSSESSQVTFVTCEAILVIASCDVCVSFMLLAIVAFMFC